MSRPAGAPTGRGRGGTAAAGAADPAVTAERAAPADLTGLGGSADPAAVAAYASRRLGVALDPATARADDSGWDFRVLHVRAADGTWWILRRPRRAEASARLAFEGAVLAAARDRIPVPVPYWRLHTPGLVAYPRLSGAPAGTEDPETLVYSWSVDPLAHPAHYLEPLARALVAVHTTALEGSPALAARAGADPGSVRARIADRLDRARAELPLPAAGVRRWQAWLDDERLWPDRLTLVHGDVHPGHTLVVRPPSGPPVLSGLLDWANADVGDPAADFVDMLYAGGTAVLDRLLAAYRVAGGEVRPGLRAHVLARASFLWVHVALRGLDTGRPAWTETALRRMTP
ncbi:macrolide phosphotransferase [Streptomyces sp. 3211.6]|uniref:macrolide 2'-phosphotransferase n=1 Tax=Streptomyces sp. 3211.6 TaxID=1938845 RepID=UPI000F2BBEA2|nr:macrolide 2'-phosphotransferase [Streptomyces sp. 3211.6]RKT02898.1 macrolide phosphotransferase [Streptomyces sp. 3211.6]